MEKKIGMMAAASETLNFLRRNPKAIDEDVFKNLSNYFSKKDLRNNVQLGMIAAASETCRIFRKNPELTDKEILRIIMESIPYISENTESAK